MATCATILVASTMLLSKELVLEEPVSFLNARAYPSVKERHRFATSQINVAGFTFRHILVCGSSAPCCLVKHMTMKCKKDLSEQDEEGQKVELVGTNL